MNHDGHLDIVFPCADPEADGTGQLAVFLGDGSDGFTRSARKVPLPHPGAALRIALGDVNEDGHADVVVGHHNSYKLAILYGDGQGGFKRSPRDLVTAFNGKKPHTHSVTLSDVNGDFHLDILTTCADDNAVAILLGNGKGEFVPAPESPVAAGNHPYEGLSLGDLNGDGNLDIAVPNLHGNAVSALLGDGTGRFTDAPGSPFAVAPRPGFVALGYLNDDRVLDMVVTHDDAPIVELLLGSGHGGMRAVAGSPVRVDQPVWTAVIADVDGDGSNDVVLGGRVDRLVLLLGDGRGGISARPLAVRTRHQMPGYVSVADLNNDGKPDLIVTYFQRDVIDIYLSRVSRRSE